MHLAISITTWFDFFSVLDVLIIVLIYHISAVSNLLSRLNNEFLYIFYCSILGSVIACGISCWGSSITAGDRKRLNSTIKKAGKIMNREVPNIETLFHTACLNKYNSILKDNDHPLNCNFITSMRSNRIIEPKSRTERYRLSFIPTAVRLSRT